MHLPTRLVRPISYHLLRRGLTTTTTTTRNPYTDSSSRAMSHPDPLSLIPPNAWDSHMHIFSPDALSPAQLGASAYVPPEATIPQALDLLGRLGAGGKDDTGMGRGMRMCIVQPSVYGVDNHVTLSGVRELNVARAKAEPIPELGREIKGEEVEVEGGCAVVEIDLDNSPTEVLDDLHRRGTRGVRLNLKSRAQILSPSALQAQLERYAGLIRPYGWVLQVYLGMGMIEGLDAGFVGGLGVPLVLDHFAHPDLPAQDGPKPLDLQKDIPGYKSLLSLYSAQGSQLYIKISGWYRLLPPGDQAADNQALKWIFFDLALIDPTRLVWGSDWPHTRFEGIDTLGWAKVVIGWCQDLVAVQQMEDQEQRRLDCWDGQAGKSTERVVSERAGELVRMVFKSNADELWLGRDKA